MNRSQEEINRFLSDLNKVLLDYSINLDYDGLLIDNKNDNNPIGYLEGELHDLQIVDCDDNESVIASTSTENKNYV